MDSTHDLILEPAESFAIQSDIAHAEAEAEAESLGRARRICPECGLESASEFCPDCGEEMEPRLPSVGHYLRELLGELASFDSKLLRTIPVLLARPGFLTLEYLAGRRKRYLLPWRLYALVGFVAFFILGTYWQSEFTTFVAQHADHVEFGKATRAEGEQIFEALIRFGASVFAYVLLIETTPLFAVMLKIIYRKSRRLFIEHFCFTFHLFAASIFIFTPAVLLPEWASWISVPLFLAYLYIALRRVYPRQGRYQMLRNLLRTLGVGFAFSITILQAVILTSILTLLLSKVFNLIPVEKLGITF